MSLHLEGVVKSFGGLRPLRIRALAVDPGTVVALAGFDQTTAEVFVNLVTGATLPDEGTVRVFGRATSDIVDSDDWLSTVDRFGIVSERVVLLERFTLLQNIAMAMTLEVEPLMGVAREQAERLASEAGLAPADWERLLADAGTSVRHRVRLARALAASPSVLLVEHPAAGLAPHEVVPLAADLTRAAAARGVAMVVLAAEPGQAAPFAPTVLVLNGGTGELTDAGGRGLFSTLRKWTARGG